MWLYFQDLNDKDWTLLTKLRYLEALGKYLDLNFRPTWLIENYEFVKIGQICGIKSLKLMGGGLMGEGALHLLYKPFWSLTSFFIDFLPVGIFD